MWNTRSGTGTGDAVNSSTADGTGRLIDTLAADPVVAILRAAHAGHLVAAAEVIADVGIRTVELPLTTPGSRPAPARTRSPWQPGTACR